MGVSFYEGQYVLLEDMTIYAQWELITYSIEYILNGGVLPQGMENPSTYNADSADITLNEPIRTGYHFIGWRFPGQSSAVMHVTIPHGSTGNRIYSADWTPITYSLHFDSNGGEGSMADIMGIRYDETSILPENDFFRKGYNFAGWATNATGEAIYADGMTVSNLSAEEGASVTLYAVWSAGPWVSLQDRLNAGGVVTLTNGLSWADDEVTMTITNTVTLDLAGHTLAGNGDGGVFDIVHGGDLTITNSVEGYGGIAGGSYGLCVSGGVFRLRGGAVAGNGNAESGAGVYVNGGTFEMSGGAISNNSAVAGGGGVYVRNGAFEMSGGEISCNTSDYGAVCVETNGTFTMSGGVITNNTSNFGGGVYVQYGTFEMSGGKISGNGFPTYGGGVCVQHGTFEMSGGEIANSVAHSGGGVYVQYGAFEMSGGSISGNVAYFGGVCVEYNSAFTMTGGDICGNGASLGGGAYVRYGGVFEMSGGAISGNVAAEGGGVFMDDGAFTLSGSHVVSGNTRFSDVRNNVFLPNGTVIGVSNLTAGASVGVTTETSPTVSNAVVVATGASAGDGRYFFSDVPGESVDMEGDSICVVVMDGIPSYLTGADELVVSNYVAWTAKYGPDATGAHMTAFLLDIDPSTPIPEGAAILKITDFTLTETEFLVEVGSDVAEFTKKGEGETSQFLGNGYVVLQTAQSLSAAPDDWTSSAPVPVKIVNGRGIADLSLLLQSGLPPGAFFKVSIIPSVPSP